VVVNGLLVIGDWWVAGGGAQSSACSIPSGLVDG